MSTRAHVIVLDTKQNKRNYVYHHSDGYLKGVGEELKDFIKNHYSPEESTAEEFCKQLENWDSSYEYENYGIHGDEEYLYYIEIDFETATIKISVEEEQVTKKMSGWSTSWKEIPEFTEYFPI